MVEALKLSNRAPRVSGESLQMCEWPGIVLMGKKPLRLAISGQSLTLNGPVVDSRDLNLVLGPMEVTHYKLFIFSSTKYTVEPSWPLVLV
ncbi:hypothetical protein TNCV_2102011 [Trichonephila clavipes]|nr:hypothetical protein TNCV_2102011 [Trichonephila clavipes]